jgi:hypothetical protein
VELISPLLNFTSRLLIRRVLLHREVSFQKDEKPSSFSAYRLKYNRITTRKAAIRPCEMVFGLSFFVSGGAFYILHFHFYFLN